MTVYAQANFVTSAADRGGFMPDEGVEVAFSGRSNAGKSSAINVLCHRRNLARTSRTPGRTQLINFFQIDEGRRLVDLPGYGYAKVPESVRRRWQALMEDYFGGRNSLRGLVVVVDIRRGLLDLDEVMLDWAAQAGCPALVLLTKCDKLNRAEINSTRDRTRNALMGRAEVLVFSAKDRTGVDAGRAVLDRWLSPDQAA